MKGCLFALAMATTLPSAAHPQALTDRTVTVSATSVHLRCGGERPAGAPLVVLEAGAGSGADSWNTVQPKIAEFARVCAYDRPGTGASGSYPAFLKAADHATFVQAMLKAANEAGPYVMVGHSVGGIIASLYAMAYPREVTGMVLVDSSHEDQERRFLPVTGPPPPRIIPAVPPPGVPPPPPPGLRLEDFSAALRETPFRGDIPLVVLTATRPPRSKDPVEIALQPIWLELQKDLAARSPRSEHRLLPNSGHLIPSDDPQAVVDAVRRVLNWH